MQELRGRLEEGIRHLELALPEGTVDALLVYLAMLIKWNKAFNLTAVRTPGEMVTRHLLDSLAVVPHLHGQRIIDVGSGAGLPGIPLALAFPQREFVLLDSNSKKTRFLTQVRAELGLANLSVVHGRVEDYHPSPGFDCVISRAYASIADILSSSGHLLDEHGEFLAMKGGLPEQELAALPSRWRVQELLPLQVPGLEQEQRHLLRIVAAA
ncbi:MAG: 16S rRNA (guanine(527)-N(7))-methyltransferase RsmG [Thiohalomonadaceae bacterium]